MSNNQKNQKLINKQSTKSETFSILPSEILRLMNNSELFITKKSDLMITAGILKGKALGFQQNIFIKHFAPRSLFNFLLRKITGSRAIRIFRLSEKLLIKGLPIPAPIAFIEPTLRVRSAFYISLAIENCEDLATAFMKNKLHKLRTVTSPLAEMLAHWHIEGAVHGDLKWSNIMLQNNADRTSIYFIDLDQTKLYSTPNIRGIIKDLSRFYRYGLELGAEEWVSSEFFPAYIDMLPALIKNKVDLVNVKEKASKNWDKKKRRKII